MRIDGYQLDYPGSSVKSYEDHAKRSGRLGPPEHPATRGYCHRVSELHPQTGLRLQLWILAVTAGLHKPPKFCVTGEH